MVVVSASTAELVADTADVRSSPRLVAVIAEELGELPGAEPWRGEILRRAAELRHALRSGGCDAVFVAAGGLIGLGEGSTPAGDDYLIGVLHALRFAEANDDVRDSSTSDRRSSLAAVVNDLGPARTTVASAAWLAAAARGEASPVWRALLDALGNGDETAVRAAGRAVRTTGHTSGAYSLRGFLETFRDR